MDEPEIPDPYCNPAKPIAITFDEITSAAYRIKSGIRYTDCSYSEHLSNLTGMEIYVKKEFLQATGSFKERGARYAMMMLPPEQRAKGIVAASAGNHALACCYHGNMLGVPTTVFMPEIAPLVKVQKCKEYKGDVKVRGKDLAESKRLALAHARDHGMMYLNGYDHPKILAGQGTVGLEVWEQVPNLQAVIVPVGGGGLIAGICSAIKALDKTIQVIGVEPERAPCLTSALKAGHPVAVQVGSTLADGLAVAQMGVNSFESIKNILDKCVTVEEQYIALAILKLVECEKSVVEGAGATPLAAILQGLLPEIKGKKVCLILSGGNMDSTVLGRVLERGMAADGRLVKVKVNIPDRVGGVEALATAIGSIGVHIKDIVHERAWVTQDVFSVEVKVVCESSGREHSLELRDFLAKKYGHVVFNGADYPDDIAKKSHVSTVMQAPVKIPAIPSEADKSSIQQQIIEFESQPIKSKDSPSIASSQTSPKRPSQQDETQTGQGEVPQQPIRSPRSSKQSAGSGGSSQEKSSQQPEKISLQKPVDSPRPGSSSHASARSGGSQTASESIQVAKSDIKNAEAMASSEKVIQQKPADGSPRPGGSLHSAGKSGGSQTASESIQVAKSDLIKEEPILSSEKMIQQGSFLHSTGKSGGSQTVTETLQVTNIAPLNADPTALSESQQRPTDSSSRPGSSQHSAARSGGSQTEAIQVGKLETSPPVQSTEGTQSEHLSAQSPQQTKPSGPSPPKPLSNCACKKRGAPGDYMSKT